jgi:hypothetical protein
LVKAFTFERGAIGYSIVTPQLSEDLNSNGKRTTPVPEATLKDPDYTTATNVYWGNSDLSCEMQSKMSRERLNLGEHCLPGRSMSPVQTYSTKTSERLQSHESIILGHQVFCLWPGIKHFRVAKTAHIIIVVCVYSLFTCAVHNSMNHLPLHSCQYFIYDFMYHIFSL